MENFEFYSPTYFVFGKGTENETGKFVKKYGGHKVLIHYGGGSVVRSGLLDRVKASLDAEGIQHVELGGVKASPHSDLVYEGIELARREGVDFVLAVGGGSVMDSAKGIALGAVYDGDFWDFYCGKKALSPRLCRSAAWSPSRRPVRKAPPTRSSPWSPRTATSTSAARTATSCAHSSPS